MTRRAALQLTPALLAQSSGFIKGLGTVSFPKDMPFQQRCALARKYGFGAIEVRCYVAGEHRSTLPLWVLQTPTD